MRRISEVGRAGIVGVFLLTAGAGCRDSFTGSDHAAASPPQQDVGAHEHRAGAHGGLIVPLDGAHYHVEAILMDGGGIRLLTLGEMESQVQEVDSQTLTAFVRPRDDLNARPVELRPEPQEGDTPGMTSAFVGHLPDGLDRRALVLVVPSIRIAGRRLRFGFETEAPPADAAMPEKVADEEERKLYLTPGGKYTEADITANGHKTASMKFAGFHATHDAHPIPGSAVCPITNTRANPKCSWIIGGKTYNFCCPPCVDEFVRKAKEDPASIREPGDYVMPKGATP